MIVSPDGRYLYVLDFLPAMTPNRYSVRRVDLQTRSIEPVPDRDGGVRDPMPGYASTQVMIGLLGGILQPHATRALVLGLGSGSTAGWLGEIASMERVDVVELERAVLKVAEVCAPVNRNVLANPKAHIAIGDARASSTKRVAAAVGEGAAVVAQVHAWLASHEPQPAQLSNKA